MIRPDFTPSALRRNSGLGFRPLGSLRPSYRTPHSAHGALVHLQRKEPGPEQLTDSKGGGHLGRPGNPRPAAPGSRARFPGRIGKRGISRSRFPAESRRSLGFSKKTGDFPIPDSGVTRVNCSGLGIGSAASIMPVLSLASHRQHAAPFRGPREGK
jgi:hypothetical protein